VIESTLITITYVVDECNSDAVKTPQIPEWENGLLSLPWTWKGFFMGFLF
jgi:hypothetical protein